MVYEPGVVALEVTNDTDREVHKGGFYFPEFSTKVILIAAADKRMITSHRSLGVNELGLAYAQGDEAEEVDTVDVESMDFDRPFSFIEDQDQNVTNRSPGQSDDWLKPTSPEATATPALKHGRISELRVERGAADRAEQLGVDIFAVSGTGEDGLITVNDVENAYEGIALSPAAGVKGGSDAPPAEEGVLQVQEEANQEVEATEAARNKARELGVNLSDVEPTGSGGRILVADVEAAAEGQSDQEVLEGELREPIEEQKVVDEGTPPPPQPGEPEPGETVIGIPEEAEEGDPNLVKEPEPITPEDVEADEDNSDNEEE